MIVASAFLQYFFILGVQLVNNNRKSLHSVIFNQFLVFLNNMTKSCFKQVRTRKR